MCWPVSVCGDEYRQRENNCVLLNMLLLCLEGFRISINYWKTLSCENKSICMLSSLYSSCMCGIACACSTVRLYPVCLNMGHTRRCDPMRVLHGRLWEQVHLLNCEHIHTDAGATVCLNIDGNLPLWCNTSSVRLKVRWIFQWPGGGGGGGIWSQATYGIFTEKHFACRGPISLVST